MARGATLGVDRHPTGGVHKARGPVHLEEVWSARNRTGTAHAWNEKYGALYDRTYRVLYDAGINEKLADELATERTLAVALASCERTFRFRHSETSLWMTFKRS